MDIEKRKQSIVSAYEAFIANRYKTSEKNQYAIERWLKLEEKYDRWGNQRNTNGIDPIDYSLSTHGILSRDSLSNAAIRRKIVQSTSPYHFGIELEIEGITDSNKIAVSDILKTYLSEECVVVYDGSLDRSGGEIVTVPLPSKNLQLVKWHKLLTALSKVGCTSHEGGRCGLHIHVSRNALTTESWRKLESFILKYSYFFKAISRRETSGLENNAFNYCVFGRNHQRKYQAVNWQHSNTIEFRFFRGTLKPSSFIASLQVIKTLVEVFRQAEHQNKRVLLQNVRKAFYGNRFIFNRFRTELDERLVSSQRGTVGSGTRVRPSIEFRRHEARITLLDRIRNSRWEGERLIIDTGNMVLLNCNRVPQHSITVPLRTCGLPMRIHRLLRLLNLQEITITGVNVPWDGYAFTLAYYRAGWGNNSCIVLRSRQ